MFQNAYANYFLYFTLGVAGGSILTTYFTKKPQIVKDTTKNENSNEKPVEDLRIRDECKMVLVVRMDLKMGVGKIAAQCSHATLGVYRKIMKKKNPLQIAWLNRWIDMGQAKITLKIDSLEKLQEIEKKAKEAGLPAESIMDAGKTQIEAGSITVLAIGPAPKDMFGAITGKLSLL